MPSRPDGAGGWWLQAVRSVQALSLFDVLDDGAALKLVSSLRQWCVGKLQLQLAPSSLHIGDQVQDLGVPKQALGILGRVLIA